MAWAARLRVKPTQIQIRALRTKWASCSSAGRLIFSRDLMSAPKRLRTEVIVHELLHLRIPNHGKLFRRVLGAYSANRR